MQIHTVHSWSKYIYIVYMSHLWGSQWYIVVLSSLDPQLIDQEQGIVSYSSGSWRDSFFTGKYLSLVILRTLAYVVHHPISRTVWYIWIFTAAAAQNAKTAVFIQLKASLKVSTIWDLCTLWIGPLSLRFQYEQYPSNDCWVIIHYHEGGWGSWMDAVKS